MRLRAAHIDDSQKLLVPFLRAHGASFQSTATLGRGAPDGVLGYCGSDCWVEFKTDQDDRQKQKGRTPRQLEWAIQWRGAEVVVLRTEDDCRALMDRMRSRRRSGG